MRRILFAVCLAAVFAAAAHAQTAQLSGYVRDSSDAVVAKASVEVRDVDTGAKHQSVSNDSGIYMFSTLKPGAYEITVQATGFAPVNRRGITLEVGQQARIDFALKVGSAEQTVNVEGDVSMVNTESASVGTVVDRQFVANMPLNGRSFQALITLTPGVVLTTSNASSPGQFSVNGQRSDTNYFTVDGVSANVGVAAGGNILVMATGSGQGTTAGGGYNNLVSIDAMQEFRVQTSIFAPEFGRTPGGQISIVTRSGTNHFHGDAFDYLRNNALDANDWIANSSGIKRQALHQNDFGGVVGGPVWKNKLFFFGSYEGLRLTQPLLVLTQVPSVAARTTGLTPAVLHPYLNAFPQPTTGGCGTAVVPLSAAIDPTGLFAPFCQGAAARNTLNAGSVRGDWNINSKMTLFARWNNAPSSSSTRSGSTNLITNDINTTSWTAGFAYTPTSSVVNDFRFNYSFVTGYQTSTLDSFGGSVPLSDAQLFPSSLTIPGLSGPVSASNTRFIFLLSLGTQWRAGNETANESRQWNYIDNVSFAHRGHQMKFGIDFRRLEPVQARAGYQQAYQFVGAAAVGSGTASIFAGSTNPLDIFVVHNTGLYAQDTWKLTPRLTLTYGVRWEYDPPAGSPNNQPPLGFNQFDPTNLGATVIAPIGTPEYHTQWTAFAPRFGVAYQLSQDPRWGRVLRGGWGLFHDTTGTVIVFGTSLPGATTGNLTNIAFPATAAQQTPPAANINPPYANGLATDPGLRLPSIYQMNVAFEQSLGTKQVFTVTYAGAIGRGLFLQQYFLPAAGTASRTNLPNGYTITGNFGASDYHSFQALYQRRLSRGVQAMASYVWSHSIDVGSTVGSNLPNFTLESIGVERASSDFDVRQSFQAAVSYDIPHPSGNAFLRNVLGNWGTDFLFRARTAPPVNITDSAASFSQYSPTRLINQRPNLVPGVPVFLYGPSFPGGKIINRAAFANQCGTLITTTCLSPIQGNLPRNAFRDYGWNQLDMTVRRDFPIHESIALQFRVDFFNIMNHPNFSFQPGTNAGVLNVASGNFGRTTSMLDTGLSSGNTGNFNPLYQVGGPRSIQLSLKLKF